MFKVVRLLFGKLKYLLLALLLVASPATAATYYAAPNGSGSACSQSIPCPVGSAFIAKASAGDTLVLNDGTYTNVQVAVNCLAGAANGTAASPITLKAANERQAFLNANGTFNIIAISNCSYWTIQGLHIRATQTDNNATSSDGYGAYVLRGDHVTFTRNLFEHTNRYKNNALLMFDHSPNASAIENEFYYFHMIALQLYYSDGAFVARNYANSRGYGQISGGWPTGFPNNGYQSYVIYPGSSNVFVNNLSEGSVSGIVENPSNTTQNNKVLGFISLNDLYGISTSAYSTGYLATNGFYQNNAVVSARTVGLYARSPASMTAINTTVIGGAGCVDGTAFDKYTEGAAGNFSITLANHLSIGCATGIYGDTTQGTWSAAILNSYDTWNNGNNEYYSGNVSRASNYTASDPGLGTCKIWTPDGSWAKGKNIGANVLYQYDATGTLTTTRLWNDNGSPAFAGAVIAGVNDTPSNSLIGVGARLNINQNGCAFPAGYTGPVAPPVAKTCTITLPQNLSTGATATITCP